MEATQISTLHACRTDLPTAAVTAQAGTITTNSIQIQWSVYPASDFAAYEIYYSTSPAVTQNSTLAATLQIDLHKVTTSRDFLQTRLTMW